MAKRQRHGCGSWVAEMPLLQPTTDGAGGLVTMVAVDAVSGLIHGIATSL